MFEHFDTDKLKWFTKLKKVDYPPISIFEKIEKNEDLSQYFGKIDISPIRILPYPIIHVPEHFHEHTGFIKSGSL
jgi:hypothetical protein